ncbi:type VI secretion system Vgr family protein [Herbaspirillum rubrisubalbicans]|uniref:type VI secretion system Vgr family protein n=1 Tax=Herbaspirillum rubrisubalbicans TaxID=80842 RepID=UPI0015583ACF|nr:type VI secretion system tip protein VgrG [Herbaspirillum rubrisubalbicans]
METSRPFLHQFEQWIQQSQHRRFMRLSFPHQDAPAARLLVQRLDAEEHVSRDFVLRVQLISDDPHLALKDVMGKLLVIELVREDGSLRYFSGHVFAFCRQRADGAIVVYEAELGPWFRLLSLRNDHYIFHDRTLLQQTEEIFADYPSHARWQWQVSADDPAMADACQFGETDHNYLSRRWEAAGWHYWYEHDASGHTLIVGSDSRNQAAIDGDECVRFHGAAGSIEDDAIDHWSPQRQLVASSVALGSFDFKSPYPSWVDIPTLNQQGQALALEHYQYTGQYGYRDLADGDAQSRLRIEEIEARARHVQGQGNCRTLMPGRWFRLLDHFELPRFDARREQGQDEFLILTVRHRVLNNYLPDPEQDHPAPYRNWFSCTRRKYPWRPGRGFNSVAPYAIGSQTATVVGLPGQPALYTDAYGRVRVQFHWDRVGQNDSGSSTWVRVASNWAGAQLGALALPRVGTEVVVQWLDGNPDRPLITGSVYNGSHLPPWELPAQRSLSGLRSRELTDEGGNAALGRSNHLILDDTAGQMQAQLHSDQASSALSLGHLHRIEDHLGRKEARGQGWELRTDAWGVLRAGLGMLITTEARARARGHAKALAETLARLVSARQQQQRQGKLAERAAAQDGAARQAQVVDALQAQNAAIGGRAGGQEAAAQSDFPELSAPLLVLSSPAGIAATSAGDTHLASAGDTAVTAGRHLSLSALGNFFASVRQAIRLFIEQAGLRIVAAAGDIDLRALKDNIHLLAKLKITQTADEIILSAHQRIVINGGGSYARLDAEGIELGTRGQFQVRASVKHFDGGKTMPVPQVDGEGMEGFNERFRVVDEFKRPLKNVRYQVRSSSGKTWEGRSDAQGWTPYFNTDRPENLEIEILHEVDDETNDATEETAKEEEKKAESQGEQESSDD